MGMRLYTLASNSPEEWDNIYYSFTAVLNWVLPPCRVEYWSDSIEIELHVYNLLAVLMYTSTVTLQPVMHVLWSYILLSLSRFCTEMYEGVSFELDFDLYGYCDT